MSVQQNQAVTGCVVHGTELMLNGVGVRKFLMVDVYKAYLYTPLKITNRDELDLAENAVRILIEFLYGPISDQRMKQAWKDAFQKALCVDNLNGLDADFDSFFDTITDYQKGDVVCYDLFQNTTEVIQNNNKIATLKSSLLANAVLDVVIGNNPIDENLKKGLLSGR